MIKFISNILGENYELLRKLGCTKSNQKVVGIGTLIFVPCIIAGFVAFLVTHQFLEIDINSSVLISLIWSLLIFIIDRPLLTIGGKNILIFIRFLLVVLHCLLGSIIIDLKVFESDINNYMTSYQRENIQNEKEILFQSNEEELKSLENLMNDKYQLFIDYQDQLGCEMDGTCGSLIRGYSNVSKKKEEMMKMREKDYLDSKTKYENLRIRLENEALKIESNFNENFNSNSILTQIEVLHGFLLSSPYSLGIYLIITLFIFLIEFLPFGIKLWGDKTPYDFYVDQRSEILIDHEKRKKEYILNKSV